MILFHRLTDISSSIFSYVPFYVDCISVISHKNSSFLWNIAFLLSRIIRGYMYSTYVYMYSTYVCMHISYNDNFMFQCSDDHIVWVAITTFKCVFVFIYHVCSQWVSQYCCSTMIVHHCQADLSQCVVLWFIIVICHCPYGCCVMKDADMIWQTCVVSIISILYRSYSASL